MRLKHIKKKECCFSRRCGRLHIFLGIMICLFIMQYVTVEAKQNNNIKQEENCDNISRNESIVPKSASEYANENYEGAIEAVKQFDNTYHFTKEQLDTVKLGEPFVVNDINMESQIEIYYYPILDDSDRVIFLLSVVNTSYGWSHSISEEWVSGLNTIGQITPDFVFYKSEENLYAENQNNIYVVQGSEDVHIKFYSLKDYSEKKEDVYKTVDNFKEVDYYDCSNSFYNVKAGYTPSLDMCAI